MNDNRTGSPQAEAQAWLTLLRNEDRRRDPVLLAEFEDWQASSELNRTAYARASRLFALSANLKSSGAYGISTARLRFGRETSWPRYASIAATILVLVYFGITYRPDFHDGQLVARVASFEPITTRKGEIRSFELSDGSVATLDTDSKIEVSISRANRRVKLSRGRARLAVVEDVRPFLVEAASGEVVTNTALFDISFGDDRSVSVELLRGNAQLRPAPEFASYSYPVKPLGVGAPVNLQQGAFKPVTFARSETFETDSEWPSGWVEFQSIRLDSLVNRANAYSARPIIIKDPSVRSLKVSGRFKIDDTQGFLRRICTLFDLKAQEQVANIYLDRKKISQQTKVGETRTSIHPEAMQGSAPEGDKHVFRSTGNFACIFGRDGNLCTNRSGMRSAKL